jgi:Cytochrome oxidase complex assembly protein 1
MDNTSGQGERAQVPAEIDRWNWSAFVLNWICGLGNETYIALLMFVLGAKGSAWAGRNTRWRDVAHFFRRVQRLWAICVIGLFVSFLWLFSHTEPYTIAVERLTQSPAAIAELGSPISAGFPSGHVSVKNDIGSAELSFSATGPKGSGTVYADARKNPGVWRLTRLELEIDGRDLKIDLGATPPRSSPLLPLD